MTPQYRKLESLISGHETRNCNVSLITAAAAVAVALSINSNAPDEKLTVKQDSSFPRAPVAGRRARDGLSRIWFRRSGDIAGGSWSSNGRLHHTGKPSLEAHQVSPGFCFVFSVP